VLSKRGSVGVHESDAAKSLFGLLDTLKTIKPGETLPDEFRLSVISLIGASGLSAAEVGQLSGLENLTMLDFSKVDFSDEHLAALHSLPALNSLQLDHTNVSNASAERIATFANLKVLGLGSTKINDEAIPTISKLTDLFMLRLDDTALTDEGLAPLAGKLRMLASLDVSGTNLSDDSDLHACPQQQ
jgi:Leucine-rich repeat (LRR) protein